VGFPPLSRLAGISDLSVWAFLDCGPAGEFWHMWCGQKRMGHIVMTTTGTRLDSVAEAVALSESFGTFGVRKSGWGRL
jgi:hypothetical protein